MALQDLLDQSAIAKLLASMTGGANMPQRTSETAQAPNMGGLMAPPPQAPSLMTPQPQGNAHEHQGGIRGGLLHGTGADRISPELAGLLTPDQQKRVKPGLARTAYGYLFERRGPEAIAQERAEGMMGNQDAKVKRDAWAKIQADSSQIQDPQARLEFVARSAAAAGLPQGTSAAQASNALERTQGAVDEPQIVRRTVGGKKIIEGLDRTGRVVWSKPDEGDTDEEANRKFQRMALRANPLAAQFQRETERHQIVAEALTTLDGLRESALRGDGAAQHMLVFSLMKLADPGSAVRQDERADTRNAANVPERMRAAYNQLLGGGGNLSEATVRDFLATVDSTKKARIGDFDRLKDQYTRRAKILDVDPELVVSDYFGAYREPGQGDLRKTSRTRPAGASDAEWTAFLRTKGERP